MFETLSDRLTQVFSSLRGKGRLSPADIDATAREIRIALLEADVALPVVRAFITAIRERARGAFLDPGDELPHDGQRDIRLKQRDANLPGRGVNVGL